MRFIPRRPHGRDRAILVRHVTNASQLGIRLSIGKKQYIMRHTHIDLASILAQPNPQVDLQLQAYEISTGNFLKAVTNYTNRAIAEITKHRDAQEADKRKLAERIQAVEVETNQCKLKEIDLLAGMSRSCVLMNSPRASRSIGQGTRGEA